jgi:hypothetical protein
VGKFETELRQVHQEADKDRASGRADPGPVARPSR